MSNIKISLSSGNISHHYPIQFINVVKNTFKNKNWINCAPATCTHKSLLYVDHYTYINLIRWKTKSVAVGLFLSYKYKYQTNTILAFIPNLISYIHWVVFEAWSTAKSIPTLTPVMVCITSSHQHNYTTTLSLSLSTYKFAINIRKRVR